MNISSSFLVIILAIAISACHSTDSRKKAVSNQGLKTEASPMPTPSPAPEQASQKKVDEVKKDEEAAKKTTEDEKKVIKPKPEEPAKAEDQKVVTPAVATNVAVETEDAPVSIDHDEVSKKDILKVTFKNLKSIKQLIIKNDLALYNGEIVEKNQVSEKIKLGNEESYCSLKINGKFNTKDIIEFENQDRSQIDAENDIYQTVLTFKNSNGSMIFGCVHTTNNYYIEDFAVNFKEMLNVYGSEGKQIETKGYTNLRTLNRRMNAIKIKDVEKFKKVVLDEKAEAGFAVGGGVIEDADKMSSDVETGRLQMACMVVDLKGDANKDQIYIRVSKEVITKNETEKTFQAVTTYRADKDNYFVLSCRMQKTAEWSELLNLSSEMFNYEALQRLEYNKVFDSMVELHKKLAQ